MPRSLAALAASLALAGSLSPVPAVEEKLEEAFSPSTVTAMTQMTAMRATRRAYSTSEAPRSDSPKRARSQVERNSKVLIMCCAPGDAPSRGAGSFLEEMQVGGGPPPPTCIQIFGSSVS